MRLRFAATILIVGTLCSAAAQAQSDAKDLSKSGRMTARDGADARTSIYDRIRAELDLDEEQEAEYDAIAAKYKKSGRRRMGNVAERGVGRRDAAGGNRRSNMESFFDEVDGILRDDQREKFAEIRAKRTSRRGPGRGGSIAQLRRLQDDLKLDEEQNEQYEALLADLEESIRQSSTGGADLAAIIDEIRAAAEEGDSDRVKELRDQLPNPRANNDRAVSEFLAEIESFLEPEQMATLESYKKSMNANRDEADLRECFKIASRLDLDRDQRLALRELQRDSSKALRAARRDPAETSRITEETKTQLRDMLTADQVAEFDRRIEETQKSSRGKRPHSRGPRGEETP